MREKTRREKLLEEAIESLSRQSSEEVNDLQSKLDEAYMLLDDAYSMIEELLKYKFEVEKRKRSK